MNRLSKRQYIEPNSITGGHGFVRVFQDIYAPTQTVADLLPPTAEQGHRVEGLLRYAVRFAKPLFKQRDEEVPVPNMRAEDWNTVAVLYVSGKLENALTQVPYLEDTAADYVKKNDAMTRLATIGLSFPEGEAAEPPPDFQFEPPTEEELILFIRFLQDAQAELKQRYLQKKGLRQQTEQQIQQQRMEQSDGGVGVAKQLGMDTGQPIPLSEYGGATYRHRTR
ncbi:MAG: hypothetical protein QXS68_07635 [Candidatus Methanomethylicaceae archaeon]